MSQMNSTSANTTTAQSTSNQPPPTQEKKKVAVVGATNAQDWMMQKESLMLRMQHMEEKLERRRQRQGELERENRQLKNTLDGERENGVEVSQFFKKQLAEKTKENLALEEKLAMIEQMQESKRQALQQEIEVGKIKHAEELAAANAEINQLKTQLNALEEWQRMRIVHENELASLHNELENEKRKAKEELVAAEQRASVTRGDLQRQKEEELKHIRQAMFSSAYEHLDEVTKATVAENDRLTKELAKQSKQADALIRDNKKLREENQELKRRVDMMDGIEKESAKRSQQLMRTIKALESQLQQSQQQNQRAELIQEPKATEQILQQPVATTNWNSRPSSETNKRVKELELEVEQLKRINERLRSEITAIETMKEESIRVKDEMHALLDQHDQATWFLLSALDEARNSVASQAAATTQTTNGNVRLDELSPEERKNVLSFFLSKLYTYKLASTEGIIRASNPLFPPIQQRDGTSDPATETAATYMRFAAPIQQQPPTTINETNKPITPKQKS